MIPMTVAQVCEAVDGSLSSDCDSTAVISGVVRHDSRLVHAGDLYVALIGETHDGHDFVSDALASGAIAAIVARPMSGATIEVSDTTVALGRLAAAVRNQTDVTVFGITGSSGKTSTKDMLGQVLSEVAPTVYPPGSFNNEIGMPMTVLSLTADTQNLVLEYGARATGDIATLARVARPDVALVTNVGSAHVGEFGSPEAIAVAKSELVAALPTTGVAVLNKDDPRVAGMAVIAQCPVRWYGMDRGADVVIESIDLDEQARPTVTFTCDGQPHRVRLGLSGAHHAHNAAAVLAAATSIGLAPEQVCAALERVKVQSRWRMEVTVTVSGATVINDAYNANPESMAAALRALVAMKRPGVQTWAVVGEMRELGDQSLLAHDEVGRRAVRLGVDRLIGIGEATRPTVLGAASEGYYGGEAYYAQDKETARRYLSEHMAPDDIVLFKASRAVALEELADQVIADLGGTVRQAEAAT